MRCCWPRTVSLGFKIEGGTFHEGVLFRKSMGDVCSKTHFQWTTKRILIPIWHSYSRICNPQFKAQDVPAPKSLAWVLSHSVMSDSLLPCGLQPTRLLRPWDSPGKNSRVCCHFLLQRIFPTQGWNPHLLQLLHCWQILCHWATRENPKKTLWPSLFPSLVPLKKLLPSSARLYTYWLAAFPSTGVFLEQEPSLIHFCNSTFQHSP